MPIQKTNKPASNGKRGLSVLIAESICLVLSLFLIEVLALLLLQPTELWGLLFGGMWAILLTGLCLSLPRLWGRILFAVSYFAMLAWTVAQAGYYQVFGKLMWMSSISFAGEGATFLSDVISKFPPLLWIGGVVLLAVGILLLKFFPRMPKGFLSRIPCLVLSVAATVTLIFLPEAVFLRDLEVWGTRSEYAQSSSYRARYETMYDARNVFDICGIFQTTFRDVWVNELYPLTPGYVRQIKQQKEQIDSYFAQREDANTNEMTGVFAGKNVILVLMESLDDWMLTPEDTPTLHKMTQEGINFTNFYSPGFGTVRTFNSEFCMNTGIYLPTSGALVFDYVTNDYRQSLANQLNELGFTSECFHYNAPDFYSRGVFEPAMGYEHYICYADYTSDKNALYDDCLLFDIPEISDIFFREGKTFNTIITRSAHLSYQYNEVLSHYALKKYPQYRGMYGSQEEDCARLKAKLIDDMFARLIAELEARGQLEDTVIIGLSDHYTYGYKGKEELLTLSGVDHELLLEKTPCFVWAANGPQMQVTKTLNTADFLPTVMNLLGIDPGCDYLGQDAFNESYSGYAIFPDGSWISQGVACKITGSKAQILQNEQNMQDTDPLIKEMSKVASEFISISNLLLTSDYYQTDQ